MSFSTTAPIEEIEDEETSSPDILESPSQFSREETPPKVPLGQPEEVKEVKAKRPFGARVQRLSTRRHTHDIETVVLEFDGCSGEESLDEEES